jgi:cytochrome c553
MHGSAMRDAVARAELEQAKREATILADLRLEGAVDPTWKQKLDAMNAAAGRVAEATDLQEASRGLAAVARTCGDCHATLRRAGPVAVEPELEGSGVGPHMVQHERAVVQMWNGLVIPSDDAWTAGARALSDAPLAPELLTPGRTPVPKVGNLAASVHELARRAVTANDLDARLALFGELMATCATCHAWLGGGPTRTKR